MLQLHYRKPSIYLTLGLIIVGTVTTIMLTHAVYSYHTTKSRLIQDIHHRAEQGIITLRENIADLIQAYAVNEYENLVTTEMEHHDIFAIIVRDFNMGRIMGEKAYVSGKIRNAGEMIVDYDPQSSEHDRRLKKSYFSQSFTIEDHSGGLLGNITVYITDDQVKAELGSIIRVTIINTLILSSALILTLFFTIRRFILRPLADIVTVIGEHDRDGIPTRAIPRHGPKEISTLSESMGTMIETIKKSRMELRELNSKLQNRIEEGVRKNTQLEKEKLEQEKLLVEQSKMAAMGEMISAIAHQWRQPLSSLALDIQDLKDAREYNELDDAYLNKMIERSMHTIHYMSQTIDDFRSFFLPNKKREPFSVYETVEATKQLLKKQFETHNITLESHGSDFWVNGFKNEFQQVLINLLNNSKDAITNKRENSGNFNGTVTVSYDKNRIRVADNGGGIPDTIINRIFEPYFSTKFSAQGTGIGLYMTKTIIERNMGGEIKAYNRDDGAVFEVILPTDETR